MPILTNVLLVSWFSAVLATAIGCGPFVSCLVCYGLMAICWVSKVGLKGGWLICCDALHASAAYLGGLHGSWVSIASRKCVVLWCQSLFH
ncbi:hypothetical protein U1Q18_040176 [Sarracenia purpurea var. burkii]